MARRTRLGRPPHLVGYPELTQWLWQVHDVVNDLPNFSITSYGDLNSVHTGQRGDIAVDVSGGQGHLWVKHEDLTNTTLWSPVGLAGYGILFTDEEAGVVPMTVAPSGSSIMPAQYATVETGIISATTGDNALFTINSEGTYSVQVSSCFTADTNTKWDCDLFQNGSELSFGWQRGIGASALPGSASFLAVIYANSGDTLTTMVKHDNVGAKTITPIYNQFLVSKLI